VNKSSTKFNSQGFAVFRNLLSKQEVQKYRAAIKTLSGLRDEDFGQKHFECPDGVSKHDIFWDIIWNPNLLNALRSLIGHSIRYTQHSDIHAHRTGGWHRDCACRTFGKGPDWDESVEKYRVVRVAIYLQSYAESGSSLGVIPGSHLHERPLTEEEWNAWVHRFRDSFATKVLRRMKLIREVELPERSTVMWTTGRRGLPWVNPSVPIWINTEPGDCVIFNQRLYHCASPINGPKYAIFLSYSPDNLHAHNHMGYYRYIRKDLRYENLRAELIDRLTVEGLYLEPQTPNDLEAFSKSYQ
jgi:hypothetical protein